MVWTTNSTSMRARKMPSSEDAPAKVSDAVALQRVALLSHVEANGPSCSKAIAIGKLPVLAHPMAAWTVRRHGSLLDIS